MFKIGKNSYFLGDNGFWFIEEHKDFHGGYHDYMVFPITREEVREIVKNNNIILDDKERETLEDNSLEVSIKEELHMRDLTLKELKCWIESSYKMGTNPIPKLKEVLNEICDVNIINTKEKEKFQGNKPTLVCWLNPEDMSVELEFYTP